MNYLHGCGSTASRLQSHYEETVYILLLGPPGAPGTHFNDLEGRNPESTLEPPNGFDPWIGNPVMNCVISCNPFHSSFVFDIETSHLIYLANQMTGFYIKCSTGLK